MTGQLNNFDRSLRLEAGRELFCFSSIIESEDGFRNFIVLKIIGNNRDDGKVLTLVSGNSTASRH